MKYEVVLYGDPVLRAKAAPVARVDGDIRALANDMLETMHAANGIGLAAEQVGRTEAICVIDVPPPPPDAEGEPPPAPEVPMPLVLINPTITASEGEQLGQEGCLSLPEIYVNVKRAETVKVAYTDLDGKPVETVAGGLVSRAIQHELDHLDGVLLVDRMSPAQKMATAGKLKRIKKQAREAAAR